MTRSALRWRLIIVIAVVGAGLSLTAVFALRTLRTQRFDGVRINLAGRQRMISQKLAKEILLFDRGQASEADIRLSLRAFDLSLRALIHGGRAPLDLGITRFQQIPAMRDSATRKQLNKVLMVWAAFQSTVKRSLSSRHPIELGAVISKNVELLREMDRSVLLMQRRSEDNSKVIAGVLGLTVAMVLGLFFAFLVRNIRQLRSASARIQKLETLLPMCSSCKSIRREGDDGDQQETWVPIEAYLHGHGAPEVSHSLCPECTSRLYPGFRQK